MSFVFDVFKHLLLRKLTLSELVEKVNFSERKFKKMHSFEEQKGTRYTRESVYSAAFRLQDRASNFF